MVYVFDYNPWIKSLDPSVSRAFDNMMKNQLALKPGEQVLIVADCDTEQTQIQAVCNAVNKIGAIWTLVVQPNSDWRSGGWSNMLTEPTKKAYTGADVAILMTQSNSGSLYGMPREWGEKVRAKKGRTFGLEERKFVTQYMGDGLANWDEIYKVNMKLVEIIENGKKIHITSHLGTDVKADIDPLEWMGTHEGIAREMGQFGGCPDGEVHFGPTFGTMKGTIIVDGPILNICGNHDVYQHVTVKVDEGKVVSTEGGAEARDIMSLIKLIKNAEWISEIGIGTNPNYIPSGSIHPEKKGLGNVHIAFGGGARMVKNAPADIHNDMVIHQAKVVVDGKVILENGKLYLE